MWSRTYETSDLSGDVDLRQLVRRSVQGEDDARSRLAADVYAMLEPRLRRMGLSREDAEDVAQQCCMQVLKRLADYSPDEGPLDRWVGGFARRAGKSHLRQQARRVATERSLDAFVNLPDALPEDITDREALSLALARMPLADRRILVMRFGMGLTSAEIAVRMHTNAAQVRKRLSRAVERLRRDDDVRTLVGLTPLPTDGRPKPAPEPNDARTLMRLG